MTGIIFHGYGTWLSKRPAATVKIRIACGVQD
jgi:hypothetical protein